MTHPSDDTGDALRRLEAAGDDLSRSRAIHFTIVFPDQDSAESFAARSRRADFKVVVEFEQTREEHPWEVLVTRDIIPSHPAITDFERELDEIARPLSGYNDGWGCFAQREEDAQ